MRLTEYRKTVLYNVGECVVHCVLLVFLACMAFRSHPLFALGASVAGVAATVAAKIPVMGRIRRNIHWYINILDTIPFMIHATDMDMNWVYMNKATADFLELDRDAVMGMHCSNWNAAICNTDRCSAYCLREGNPTTFFEQNGLDLRVDTNWLEGKQGDRIGYVEVVQDISSMVAIQKEQEELVSHIRDMYHSLISASFEIEKGSEVLAQGTAEQAAAVEELSCAIAEAKIMVQKNFEKAEEAASLAETIQQDALTGGEQMRQMTLAVQDITQASSAIGNVIKLIDDIAFQTNILALNASVEAARAGAHGRGFAVVANEVRSLAAKSAEAAKDTSALIQDSIKKAELGAGISRDTAASLAKIIDKIQQSNRLIDEITESTRQQSVAITQINEGIESVGQVVQQNTVTAQQSTQVSREMSNQAGAIQDILNGDSSEYRPFHKSA